MWRTHFNIQKVIHVNSFLTMYDWDIQKALSNQRLRHLVSSSVYEIASVDKPPGTTFREYKPTKECNPINEREIYNSESANPCSHPIALLPYHDRRVLIYPVQQQHKPTAVDKCFTYAWKLNKTGLYFHDLYADFNSVPINYLIHTTYT